MIRSESEICDALEAARDHFRKSYPLKSNGDLVELDEDGEPLTKEQWMGAAWAESAIATLEWVLGRGHYEVHVEEFCDIVSARE
jgi:hypothetical protein